MAESFGELQALVLSASYAFLLVLERLQAFQRQAVLIEHRWPTNFGLLLISPILVGLVLPISAIAVAETQTGGLAKALEMPLVVELVAVFLLLDCSNYWIHRVYHRFPLLWRAHLVHHSDTQIDVTTTERHHPLETLLNTMLILLMVLALGLSAQALGVYLLGSTVVSLLTHANLRLPAAIDRCLRVVVVTPAFHAVHHSDLQEETDSNYGVVFTIWDRLFGTMVNPDRARIPHFGLEYFSPGAGYQSG